MEGHRWYACLEPTVDVVVNALRPGATVVDYACGTGILARRLLPRLDDVRYLLVDVDDAFLRAGWNACAMTHASRSGCSNPPTGGSRRSTPSWRRSMRP